MAEAGPVCGKCGQWGKLKCASCKRESYCSKECQAAHWEQHKPSCTSTEVAGAKQLPAPAATKVKLWFVQCSSMGEDSHTLGVFETKASAEALASDHDKVRCPRTWGRYFFRTEAEASALTGADTYPGPPKGKKTHNNCMHDVDVHEHDLKGPLPVDKIVWLVIRDGAHIGEHVHAIFPSMRAALVSIGLPPTTQDPPTRAGGTASPLDAQFGGEGRHLIRSVLVSA